MRHSRTLLFLALFVLGWAGLCQAAESIFLKVVAVNPSQEEIQRASVKAYLPKEAKPEDIVSREDLEISYDTQQGSYFVHGDYELQPGEVMEKTIEMRDIWTLPETELESLRVEAMKLEGMLKRTEFGDRVAFLRNSIESKLNQILEIQKNPPANPERHISDFRDNLKIFESVKADLALARSLLAQAKPFPHLMVWRVILAILIFLGLLGASFYLVWQKQAKVLTEETFAFGEAEGQAASAPQAEPKGGAAPAPPPESKGKERGLRHRLEQIIRGEEHPPAA